jgi:hypothetical protein
LFFQQPGAEAPGLRSAGYWLVLGYFQRLNRVAPKVLIFVSDVLYHVKSGYWSDHYGVTATSGSAKIVFAVNFAVPVWGLTVN